MIPATYLNRHHMATNSRLSPDQIDTLRKLIEDGYAMSELPALCEQMWDMQIKVRTLYTYSELAEARAERERSAMAESRDDLASAMPGVCDVTTTGIDGMRAERDRSLAALRKRTPGSQEYTSIVSSLALINKQIKDYTTSYQSLLPLAKSKSDDTKSERTQEELLDALDKLILQQQRKKISESRRLQSPNLQGPKYGDNASHIDETSQIISPPKYGADNETSQIANDTSHIDETSHIDARLLRPTTESEKRGYYYDDPFEAAEVEEELERQNELEAGTLGRFRIKA
jgi:hypothetical protein